MQVATMNTAVTNVYVCGHYVQFRGHMQNNVTACQKAQCVFHGIPRERDRTTGVHACVGTAEGVPRPVETNSLDRVYLYSTLRFHDTMQVASRTVLL